MAAVGADTSAATSALTAVMSTSLQVNYGNGSSEKIWPGHRILPADVLLARYALLALRRATRQQSRDKRTAGLAYAVDTARRRADKSLGVDVTSKSVNSFGAHDTLKVGERVTRSYRLDAVPNTQKLPMASSAHENLLPQPRLSLRTTSRPSAGT